MKRKVRFICFVLLLVALFSVCETAFAYSGSDYTSNTSLATKIDNLIQGNVTLFSNDSTKFKVGMRLNNDKTYYWQNNYYSGKQCYAYGQAAYYYLFGESPVHGDRSYSQSIIIPGVQGLNTLSYDILANAGVGCGAYIRTTVNASGSYNGSYGHSMIVLGYDSSSITIIHGNSDGNGLISVNTYSWSKFNSTHISGRNRYVSHIIQPNLTANANGTPSTGTDTGTIQYYERAIYKGDGTSDNNVKKYPYSGSDIETLEENYGTKQFTVTHAVKNKHGNIWYAVEGGGYIYSGDVTYVRSCPTFRIENENTPSGNLGSIDAFFNKGTIVSSDSILKATSAIYTSSNVLEQGPYTATTSSLTQKSLNMNKTDMAYGLAFGKLPAGSYTYVVKVWYGNHGLSQEVIRSNFTIGTATPTYALDVAARIDGVEQVNLAGLGTFDMYINNTLVANDVTDYNAPHPSGTKYQITDITTNSVTNYTGVYSGSLSGTTGSADKKIVLSFEDIPTVSIPSAYSVNMGYRVQLPGGETTDAYTSWQSSDTSILKTDTYGYVCGVMPGTAVVTATSSSGEVLGSCTVTVVPNQSNIGDVAAGSQTSTGFDAASDMKMLTERFIPEHTGYYTFYSNMYEDDTYGYVYDENWQCITYDDDDGEDRHFQIRFFAEKGETYYLAARLYSVFSEGGISVVLVQSDEIAELQLDALSSFSTTNEGEYAYYSFTPSVSGYYTIGSVGNNDTIGELYHCPDTSYPYQWELLGTDDDSGDNLNFQFEHGLVAGETYIVAAGLYSAAATDTISVLAEKTVWNIFQNERQYTDQLLPGAYAYYRFTPDQTGFYHFTSYGNNDTYGYLYDGDTWAQLSSNDDDGDGNNFNLVYYMTAGKTYILGARFYSSSTTGSVEVEVEKHAFFELALDEDLNLEFTGDGAWYNLSFTPGESGTYVFRSSGTGDSVASLYDSAMENQLSYDDDSGDELNFLLQYDMTAGTTYVLSTGYYSSDISGSYTVRVEKYVPVDWISAGYHEMLPGETGQVSVYVEPFNASNRNYWINPIDNDVCMITEDGYIVAKSHGTAVTTVYSEDDAEKECDILVFVHEALKITEEATSDADGNVYLDLICSGSDSEMANVYELYLGEAIAVENCEVYDKNGQSLSNIQHEVFDTDMGYRISIYQGTMEQTIPVSCTIRLHLKKELPEGGMRYTYINEIKHVYPVVHIQRSEYVQGFPYYSNVTAPSEFSVNFPPAVNPLTSPDFVLPASMKVVHEQSFMSIAASNIKVPDGVIQIDSMAFAGCTNLKGIYIPSSCTLIADDAFAGANTGYAFYCEMNSYAARYASVNGIPCFYVNME